MPDVLHAAVLAVLLREESGCARADLTAAAASATIRRLAPGVVLAGVHGQCVCGAQNCPYYALRPHGRDAEVLLSTFGIAVEVRRGAVPPEIVVLAHDSALVTDRVVYAYRGGRYVATSTARVRGDTGAAKPDEVVLRFAPGRSSAPLRGTVTLGWGDLYAFRARRGQRIVVDAVRAPAPLALTLAPASFATSTPLRAGAAVVLAADGDYVLGVETDAERDVRYTLRVTIR